MHPLGRLATHSCPAVLSDTPEECALGKVDVLCPMDDVPFFRESGSDNASK